MYSKSKIVITPAPKVSIVIPVRNYARFIAFAIESLFAQDYAGEIEIIVVDTYWMVNTKNNQSGDDREI